LAELAGDEAIRDSRRRTTVGDAAVWALSRQHDPRCLPELVRRLTGDRLGFALHGEYFAREPTTFPFWLPGIEETLVSLHAHADDLVGAVCARLAATDDWAFAARLCDALGAWGPAAQSAVPVLLDRLADQRAWPAAARALGAIGPAAVPAADALRRRIDPAGTESAAAWAYWQITGDIATTVDSFLRLAGAGPSHGTLRHLADLGPLAAAATDALRQLTRQGNDAWVRVEAAHALWRVTGDPGLSVPVLAELAEPLSQGHYLPAAVAALEHLDNPRRLAGHGGWRTFTEDEQVRAAARLMDTTTVSDVDVR
jgi:hypothetical protein